ncbi:MAG: nucleotidyltransferase domain-containing protein [Nanoarchaeota archaeon]|nr:nucleotidyltransferase domain-containing protein [Nanoarchaeota archaeon]
MENKLRPLFFKQSLRRWHFEALMKESGLSRNWTNAQLKELLKSGFVKKVKPKGKMPHYEAVMDDKFKAEKRLYGLKLLEEAGLFSHINSLKGIKTAILFGSFARGNWSFQSDIDLFIFGDDSDFEKGKLESKLGKEIQIFSFNDPKEVSRRLDPNLIPNIAKGFNIKGNLEPFKVNINA